MRKTVVVLLLLTAVSASALTPPAQGVFPRSGWTFGPVRARVFGPSLGCTSGVSPCRVQVFFGDVEAQVLEKSAQEIKVLVPGRDEQLGLVDVRVVVDDVPRLTLPRAFSWSPTLLLDPPNYTPLLVPVLAGFAFPGADGTRWQTELKIFNGAAADLRPVSVGGTQPQYVIPHDTTVRAGETQSVLTFRHGPGGGAIIHIPTPLVDSAHFALRVRNLSSAIAEGTDLPLVRREEFRPKVTLIDIPTDEQFRATLRIYHWSETPGLRSRVTIYAEGETNPLRVIELASTGQEPRGDFFGAPAYAQVDLLTPELRADADNIRVEIEKVDPNAPPIWAFVSLTHNATHQVLAIVPQSKH